MPLSNWAARAFQKTVTNVFYSRVLPTRRRRSRRPAQQISLESLEPRQMLSINTVTTNADFGAGSLRQAIIDANATSANDDIVFASSLFTNGVSTITLGSAALPTIAATSGAGSLAITGPGASSLIISGNNGNNSRNFSIFNIASGGNLSISGVTVSGAKTTDTYGKGGSIINSGTLNISSSVITGNSVSGSSSYGGGIQNDTSAILTISNTTISGNSSANHAAGINNDGTISITSSTISGNTAANSGGGFVNFGTLSIFNSTIFGNTATLGSGGGIFNNTALNITNTTIASNSAVSGGGILGNGGSLNIANTIIANSTSGGDYAGSGTIGTNLNNLVEDGSIIDSSSTPTGSGNISGDPVLGTLQNNGGPTQTLALLSGSPAIAAGDATISNAAPVNSLDQRGVTRSPTAPSIGAFEYINDAPVLSTAAAGSASGSAFTTQPIITIKDALGNIVTTSTASVTMTVSGNGTTVGTTTVNAVAGVATFSDVGISGTAGTAYTLTFTSGSLATAAQTITPTFGIATRATLTTAAAGSASGSVFTTQPIITIKDTFGNIVTTSTASVTMTVSGNGTTVGTTINTVNAVNGVATFSGVGISGTAGTAYTLTFTSGSLTTATQSITPTFGLATQVALSTSAAGSASGSAFTTQPVVTIKDSFGNTITNSTALVTMTVSGNGTTVGTTINTVNAVNGVATFSGVGISGTAGTAYTLTFTSGSLTTATQSITPTFGLATQATLSTSAAGSASGSAFTTQPIITIKDTFGNTVTNSTASVTMTVSGNGTTVGTTTVNAVNGVATFSGVGISGTAGTAYTLTFTSGSLTTATQSITPTFGLATQATFTTQAAGSASGSAFTTQPIITIKDTFGNTVTNSTASVTMTVSGNGTTVGTATVTAVAGVATFSDVGISGTAGTAYTLTFTSAGLTSATQSITPLGAANTPTFGTPTSTSDGFTVQISNYDNNFIYGGTATANGTVSIDGSGVVTVSGVAANTACTATITTTQTGYASGSATVTETSATATVPSRPTSVAAVSGNTQLAVTWVAPANTGGSAITEYIVKYSSSGGVAGSWTRYSPGSPITASPCTVTGLANGTAYVIKVIAKNAVGISLPSANSAPATPAATVPGRPTSVVATSGNASLGVTWGAPASTGGSAITEYIVKYSSNNGAAGSWTRYRPGLPITATACTVTGLTNGTAYVIKVIAKNVSAISLPSANSAPATPAATVPGAPTSVVAVSGNAQLAVTWTAPVSTGGSAITEYIVKYSSNSGASWTRFFPSSGLPITTNSCTVTGLTNGTAYVIKVIARNAVGISLPSANSAPFTPATPTFMSMVTVGNPGNAADAGSNFPGYGDVSYSYQIGTYDVTGSQYTAFLNAVGSTDTYGLYSASMGTDTNVAQISQSGSSGSYTYAVANSTGSRPVSFVTWFDCARFSNWMSNGQPSGAQTSTTTENGAYNVNGATSGNAVAVNTTNPNTTLAPTFRMPLENEWYKAAYYSPNYGGSGIGGYSAFATQSNSAPGTTIGGSANQVNYNGANVQVIDVGSFTGSGSYYGTFDQSGNVYQWNDLDGTSQSTRGFRGGNWYETAYYSSSSFRYDVPPSTEVNDIGFRLASPVTPTLTPAFDTPTATADGFTVVISNYDSNYTWAGTATASGTVVVTDNGDGTGLATITGVAANTSSTATITTTRTGYVGGSNTVAATSLNTALTPTFGTPTATADGFTVVITNYDSNYTWAGTATASGTVVVTDNGDGTGLATINGVAPGTSSTAAITTTRNGYTVGSANVAATSLLAALNPTFGTPTATADGFTVVITNYDATYTWAGTATASGTVVVTDNGDGTGLATITGVAANTSSTATITTARTGYAVGTADATETSL